MKLSSLSIAMVMLMAIMALPIQAAYTGSDDSTVEPAGDFATLYLERHELNLAKGASRAVVDGTELDTEPINVRNGRTYIPIKLIEQAGVGSVSWDAKNKQAVVHANSSIQASTQTVAFRNGQPSLFRKDGAAYEGISIPAPFLLNGRMYVPAGLLPMYGVAVGYEQGVMIWRWSDKIFDLTTNRMETGEQEISFTVLFQKEMNTPQLIAAMGGGGWMGSSGEIVEKNIKVGDKTYHRVQFTVQLKPGTNPIELMAVSAGSARFEIVRTIDKGSRVQININEEGSKYIAIKEPDTGYVRLKQGERLALSGNLKEWNESFDQLTVHIHKYADYDYTVIETIQVPIEKGQFITSLSIQDKGEYLIQIVSPKYLPFIERSHVSTTWAEFKTVIE
ncbi:stalk domain-containing protein [Paenibacillus abyssi]|uniref:Copper amine oxidase-like N-terminal domain-containing protein n=1 Tax=Paenibacillus abyssi TaxID=1340531 RepID=A0A917G6Z1_9BACL|nr:stalk domain-containing protein [Paenibacillus abyssi]GGG24960.1 hypothetical protein GCM10010916_46850 [Paenibacillus abyssi]